MSSDVQAQRVLVVEDDFNLLRLYCKVLAAEGHHIHQATTLQAAVYLLGKHEYDVCIFDLHIGLHSGVELLSLLPTLQARGMRPIVMSGHAKYQGYCHDMGIAFYMKPVANADLVAAVAPRN